MKKFFALALMLTMLLTAFAACGSETTKSKTPTETETETAPAVTPARTYAEFVAAELEAPVEITAYVQLKQVYSAEYGNTSLFLADKDGAYFAYRLVCTQEQYDALEIGQKITVSGFKASWAGEDEINEGCTFTVVDGGDTYIAPVFDATDLLGTEELISKINAKVSFKGLTVAASKKGEEEVPFLYNWDGSGVEGDDLYFNVTNGKDTFQFMVETSEFSADSDVYKAAQTMNIGAQIDVEGFLYWYNGPNPHVCVINFVPGTDPV